MPPEVIWILICILVGAIFFGIGYMIRKSIAEAKISSAEQAAIQIVENAKKEADALKKRPYLRRKTKSTDYVRKLKRTFVNVVTKHNV